jgi:hypothetical protein
MSTQHLPTSIPPRLLTTEQAAEYCNVSSNTFEEHVGVNPVRLGKRKLWDRKALDEWLDSLQGRGETSTPQRGWRSPRHVREAAQR